VRSILVAAAAAAALVVHPAHGADGVKIALVSTLSGPLGSFGKHIKDGVDLALDGLGKKMGGLPVELLVRDDQAKPDLGRQVADEVIKRDKVNFIVGVTLSNVLLAIYPMVTRSETIMFGGQGGPSLIAGTQCSPYFFSVGIETSSMGEAMGKVMQDEKIDGVYLMTPNYAGGKDVMEGFKRYYKGKIASELYTPLDQTDFQTELSQLRAANPSAVFVFYPGGLGVQFVKQYAQAGLRARIPLYTIAMNETILPAVGDAAEGNFDAANWSPYLDNPVNKQFVSEFRKKYGYMPSEYAAVAFDTILLIDSAVRAVGGKLENKAALVGALEKADFKSVRGNFAFNKNHFPIQDWHLLKMTKDADGSIYRKPEKIIVTAHKDSYAGECQMKPPK
jgi:branched-chain amino acid transport system substrate-binding protein